MQWTSSLPQSSLVQVWGKPKVATPEDYDMKKHAYVYRLLSVYYLLFHARIRLCKHKNKQGNYNWQNKWHVPTLITAVYAC